MLEWQIRAEIVEIGRRLYARGLISGHEGNISARQRNEMFITPAGVCKGFLTPDMIVRADLEGRRLDGMQRVSTEVLMHTAIYARRDDVAAVVHAHPPTATAFAVAGIALDRPLLAESVAVLGAVPVVSYAMPGTPEFAKRIGDAICGAQGLLLANHGALAVGDSLEQGWERMETLEQLARIELAARQLGTPRELPPEEVAKLKTMGYPPFCREG
jgi:L-fuculose-phosphate aldolase